MTGIDFFNIVAGLCSVAGLIFSVWIFVRTGKIQKNIEYNHRVEQFNINHDRLMEDLRSSGLNAIREEFPNISTLFKFQQELLKYSKEQALLLTPEEQNYISEMVDMINSCSDPTSIDKSRYLYLLNEITTKPSIWRN